MLAFSDDDDDDDAAPPAQPIKDVAASAQSSSRFVLFPSQRNWAYEVALMDIGATACDTSLDWWTGGLPVPRPRLSNYAAAPWLLPSTDDAANWIASNQEHLRKVGWRILSSPPALVEELGDKSSLRVRAERLGLCAALPRGGCGWQGGCDESMKGLAVLVATVCLAHQWRMRVCVPVCECARGYETTVVGMCHVSHVHGTHGSGSGIAPPGRK